MPVRISAPGMKNMMPSSPQNRGSTSGSPTPKTISRSMDSAVESPALPIACRKMNAPLFTQDSAVMERNTRMHRTAKRV